MSLPRYGEYKDSRTDGLGQIPSHWSVPPLYLRYQAELGKMLDAGRITGENLHRYLRNVDVQWGRINFEDLPQMDIAPSEVARYTVRPGDLLVCEGGEVGRAAVVQAIKGITAFQKALHRLRPIRAHEVSKYMFYVLRWAADTGAFSTNGQSTIAHLTGEQLRKYRFPCPPCGEQIAIAAFLDRETAKIDALIAEQEKLIALLAEKRQATISHAVTRGLDRDAPVKDSGVPWLGDVPAHWCMLRVKTVSQFTTSGPRGWSERIAEGGSLFIQSGDLNDSLGIEFETAKRVNVGEDAEAARTRLAEGDVVVCITGAKTGNVALCPSLHEAAYVNQHLCLIRPTEAVYAPFLALALKSNIGQTQFELSQYGLKQGLSLENVRELWVALPPREEQEAIVAFLQAEMGKLTSLAQAADDGVSLLKERRSALIAAAVTGQIDVRAVANASGTAAKTMEPAT